MFQNPHASHRKREYEDGLLAFLDWRFAEEALDAQLVGFALPLPEERCLSVRSVRRKIERLKKRTVKRGKRSPQTLQTLRIVQVRTMLARQKRFVLVIDSMSW